MTTGKRKISGTQQKAVKIPELEALAIAPTRRPRFVNRPAKATEEGFVTLGFRGTTEDDELVREAVEAAGFYSKAELVRQATLEVARKIVSGHRRDSLVEAAQKLGVSPNALAEFLKKAAG